jgi:hypothetical protein
MGRRVYAVIPAAGCGLRFGGKEPKQYSLISVSSGDLIEGVGKHDIAMAEIPEHIR